MFFFPAPTNKTDQKPFQEHTWTRVFVLSSNTKRKKTKWLFKAPKATQKTTNSKCPTSIWANFPGKILKPQNLFVAFHQIFCWGLFTGGLRLKKQGGSKKMGARLHLGTSLQSFLQVLGGRFVFLLCSAWSRVSSNLQYLEDGYPNLVKWFDETKVPKLRWDISNNLTKGLVTKVPWWLVTLVGGICDIVPWKRNPSVFEDELTLCLEDHPGMK